MIDPTTSDTVLDAVAPAMRSAIASSPWTRHATRAGRRLRHRGDAFMTRAQASAEFVMCEGATTTPSVLDVHADDRG